MLISLKNVDFYYSKNTAYEIQALKDISIDIDRNEFVGVIGHTGSGKSTFLQLLNGLEKPTDGEVLYDGKNIWDKDFDRKELRSKVGLVFQYPEHQLFEVDVISDVSFAPKNFGCSADEAKQRAIDALKKVNLDEKYYKASPFDLSGGQKRRVAIAGVLASNPQVLILDEPTAGLDPSGKEHLLDMLDKLHYEENISIILVSHSMEDVASHARRVLVFDKGSIIMDDKTEAVFSQVDKLESIQLAAPQVCYILKKLKAKGLDVDTDAITLKSASDTIIKALRR